MRYALLITPFIVLLGGCFPSRNTPLPDKRAGIPDSVQVNNYLEQVVTPKTIHCLQEQSVTATSDKTFFHNDYAKISTNLVGQDVSYRWDESWNRSIGESLEKEHPEFLNGELDPSVDELSDLGCSGYKDASKKDNFLFWPSSLQLLLGRKVALILLLKMEMEEAFSLWIQRKWEL